MDWTKSYEYLADRFFDETRLMAPGKSLPPEMIVSEEVEQERKEKWQEFMTARSEEAWTLWHQHYGMYANKQKED